MQHHRRVSQVAQGVKYVVAEAVRLRRCPRVTVRRCRMTDAVLYQRVRVERCVVVEPVRHHRHPIRVSARSYQMTNAVQCQRVRVERNV